MNFFMRATTLLFVTGLPLSACSRGVDGSNDTAAAPVDTAATRATRDTTASSDTLAKPTRQPPVATPPITPPAESAQDTPPSGSAESKSGGAAGGGPKVGQAEYEGWRQYSVNCARCHGQDALPNPVAANLLVSLGPGGPIDTEQKFFQVVSEGRPERGMPAFTALLTPDQIRSIYAYVDGRAEKKIPPGRPASPSSTGS